VGASSPQLDLGFSCKKTSEALKSGECDGQGISENREIKRAENIPCRVNRCTILFKPHISQTLPQPRGQRMFAAQCNSARYGLVLFLQGNEARSHQRREVSRGSAEDYHRPKS
jgi:hypothetical protein